MTAARYIIPRREPELIAREEQRHYAGWDKVATTSLDHIVVKGVRIESRHNKAHEFEAMLEMVLRCNPFVRCFISKLWCNSNVGHVYVATILGSDAKVAKDAATELHNAAIMLPQRGHNGVSIDDAQGEHLAFIDCHWEDDEV